MAVSFEWRNNEPGASIETIYHNPRHGVSTLACASEAQAAQVAEKLALLDCVEQEGRAVILSGTGLNALELGGLLLEQGLINQSCFDEMQSDIKQYRSEGREGPSGGRQY